MRGVAIVFVMSIGGGCAHNRITGTVVDRNGAPVPGVIVGLTPGNVEVLTDAEGNWAVDYLRDDAGSRIRLGTRRDYDLEVFRLGYHAATTGFRYQRGSLDTGTLTLVEDGVRVATPDDDIDPGREAALPRAAGAAYEGE